MREAEKEVSDRNVDRKNRERDEFETLQRRREKKKKKKNVTSLQKRKRLEGKGEMRQ